jgi:hypothetical protein
MARIRAGAVCDAAPPCITIEYFSVRIETAAVLEISVQRQHRMLRHPVAGH